MHWFSYILHISYAYFFNCVHLRGEMSISLVMLDLVPSGSVSISPSHSANQCHLCVTCLWLAGPTLYVSYRNIWAYERAKQILYPLSLDPCEYCRQKTVLSESDGKNGQIPEPIHLLAVAKLWVRGICEWAKNKQTPGHFSLGKREKDGELYQSGFLGVPVEVKKMNLKVISEK